MDTSSETKPLSHLAKLVIASLEKKEEANHERKLRVNPVISKVASWYEKLRNAMEYREDEVILRAAIERILKRRLLLGGNAKTTAEPLVRELIWARYLADNAIPESTVSLVEQRIDIYLSLRFAILQKHKKLSESTINEWISHLMSSDIAIVLNPNKEKETIANFMFQILREHIDIVDDTEETKNAQVFIAVRKAFGKDDLAFLRFHLFTQYFGKLTEKTHDRISSDFMDGYQEILKQLNYPRKDTIYGYIKRRTAAFLILENILRVKKDHIAEFLQDTKLLSDAVYAACTARYESTSSKVRRAIIRSVIFIFLTKAFFALAVEGTYERIRYGHIMWFSIGLNTGIPPLLMIFVGLFMKVPDEQNTKLILTYIERILFDEKPRFSNTISIKKLPEGTNTFLHSIFSLLWFLAFILSFGGIIFILTKLHFNVVSQFIFVFFLAVVSFLAYRISLIAHLYRVGQRQGVLTPLVDFFFMPVVRVGRHLTQGISQLNFLILIFDFIIETPFKAIFAFFEQWFHFLHAKREEME